MQKSRHLLLLLVSCALLLTHPLRAQLGMGGKPHASAALDVQSTNKAFYPPRLTTTQRNAIADPQPGALVFDTDKSGLYLYDGTSWMVLAFTTPEAQFSNQVNAGDGLSGDSFGYSVGISGDYAVIGAPDDDVSSNVNQGSAYIFKRSGSGWAYQDKITASDGSASDSFGYSVAIDGTHIVVGAYGDNSGLNTNQGAAYFFYRSGTSWIQQEKVTASDANGDDLFGFRVSVSGSYAIIGAPGNDISGKNSQGAVYIFLWIGIDIDPFAGYVNWTEQDRLLASDGLADDEFGRGVAIAGDYAIVGAPFSDNGVTNSNRGSAYIFFRSGSTWSQQGARLTNGTSGGSFGFSVGISSATGGYAIIGAPNRDIVSGGFTVSNVGAAYIYARSGVTWSQQTTLIASDGAANDYFGISVGITASGGVDRVVVGANGDDIGANTNQGAAYLYERSGSSWPTVRKLNGVSGINADNGRSVDISGTNFIIGAPGFNNSTGKATFGNVDN